MSENEKEVEVEWLRTVIMRLDARDGDLRMTTGFTSSGLFFWSGALSLTDDCSWVELGLRIRGLGEDLKGGWMADCDSSCSRAAAETSDVSS